MKAVIFDLDGCLADSEVLCLTAFAELLTEAGASMDWVTVRDRFLGRSIPEILTLVGAETGARFPADFGSLFEARVRPLYEAGLRPIPGAAHLLTALGPVPRAIATGGSLIRMGFTLQIAGLDGFFGRHGYSGEQVARGKPHPDLFLFAAAQLGVAPQECLVLEDSPHGIAGARAAGMTAFGLTAGSHLKGIEAAHAERLRAAGAARVFAALDEAEPAILSVLGSVQARVPVL